jgi:hypothetical protein
MGCGDKPTLMEQDTWIEPESLCYPGGGMHRRARALCPDGKLRVVVCGLPDTFFSIPAKGGGWIGFEDDVVKFHPPRKDPAT